MNKVVLCIIAVVAVIVVTIAGFTAWSLYDVFHDVKSTQWGEYLGDEKADKVVVEFLDYRCSYCREMHDVSVAFVKDHPDVKIVYRHLPVFGEASVREARLALAAGMQGHFVPVHNYLMSRKTPLPEGEIQSLAVTMGLDYERLAKDMGSEDITKHLLRNVDASEILGINATPAFLVGNVVHNGKLDAQQLESMLEQAYGQ